MKTAKQGLAECFPAACAALSGRPLADIMREAAHAAGVTDWCGMHNEWFERVWRNYTVCRLAFAYLRQKYTPWLSVRFLYNTYGSARDARELPPGRGVVTFYKRGSRHILAYADGMLFVSDVNYPDIMTLTEYLAASEFAVEKIIPEVK